MTKAILVLCTVTVLCAHADTTFVSGTVSGVWPAHETIVVTGDIVVGDTLTIEPGVHVLFPPGSMMTVYDVLQALGTASDSILFTCASSDTGQRWDGIRLAYPALLSHLQYCTVERVQSTSGDFRGIGLLIDNASVIAANCVLHDCHAGFGNAVYLRNGGRIDMTDCEMTDNGIAAGAGGAVSVGTNCIANLTRCRLKSNQATDGGAIRIVSATVSMVDCDFDSNYALIWGGAVITDNASYVTATGCRFRHNRGGLGGAIYANFQGTGELRLVRCLFYDNVAQSSGGGAVSSGGVTKMIQCTVVGNNAPSGGGIYAAHSDTVNSTIFAFNYNGGITGDTSLNARYCDLYANGGNDSFPDPSNLYRNPQFSDYGSDFSLLRTSPCIDTGDPSLPHDPDSTRADMGCYYFNQSAAASPRAIVPHEFTLSAWPNPFNSSVRLTFSLPRAGHASLTIFDVLGRQTAVLMNQNLSAGAHTQAWNASSSASGVYFAILNSGGNTITQKLLLLK